jgi:squalene synthase HpnC
MVREVPPRDVPPRAIPPPGGVLRQARRENFVVASRVLPRNVRDHLLAIYGFARLVDDIGDEVPGDRLALLAWVDGELDAIDAGATPTDPILRRVAVTIRALDLPTEPFRGLIEANRQDQVVTRYETSEDLLSYCELSANPVGRLVLRVFGMATPDRDRLSDAICTGLQLTEHWQDIAEDFANGRVYLPQEDLRHFGCSEADLAAPSASPALRRLVAFEVDRARSLLVRGSPLVREMRGRARVALAGFVGGGHAALDGIEGANHDVLAHRPTPSRTRRLGRTLAELVPLTERGRA